METDEGMPLDEEDTKQALQQLELPVTEVSSTRNQKGHCSFQDTNHTALPTVDKVEPFTQKEFMFGNKPAKVRVHSDYLPISTNIKLANCAQIRKQQGTQQQRRRNCFHQLFLKSPGITTQTSEALHQ